MSQGFVSVTLIVIGEDKTIAQRFHDVVIRGIPAHCHPKDMNCYSMDAVRPEGVQVFLNARQRLLTTGEPATLLLFIVPSLTNGELSARGREWVKAFPWCHLYCWAPSVSTATQPNAMGVVNDAVLSSPHAVDELWQPLLRRAVDLTPGADTHGLMHLIP
jgi:hypothetical protein